MWPIAFAIATTLAVITAFIAVYLFAARRSLIDRQTQLQTDLADREKAIESYLDEIEDAKTARAELEKQLAVAGETQKNVHQQFETAQKQLRQQFEALASEALDKSTKRFLQLANENFEGKQKDATAELDKRKQAIETLIKPMRESLDKHAQTVDKIEKQRIGDTTGLKEQLATMHEAHQQLTNQTQNLANAMRRSDVRGRWGELSLKRIAEMAGMVPHCDFEEQITVTSAEGRQRPDMVVHMPSDRTIVIDAKAPMAAYLEALEKDRPDDRKRMMEQHLTHVENRVRELSNKNYSDQFERSPDFVVLFIPGDSFLHPAVELKPDLIESALARGVVIATPTTLISLLRIIELGWREEKIAENARKVSDLGKELHERIVTATGHITQLGDRLGKAVDSYNKFLGSYESRVVSSARKFKDLHADSSKALPETLVEIEAQPRDVRGLDVTPGEIEKVVE